MSKVWESKKDAIHDVDNPIMYDRPMGKTTVTFEITPLDDRPFYTDEMTDILGKIHSEFHSGLIEGRLIISALYGLELKRARYDVKWKMVEDESQ
jgi:hypothetical protein